MEKCPVCNDCGIYSRWTGKYSTVTEFCPRGCAEENNDSTNASNKVINDILNYLK